MKQYKDELLVLAWGSIIACCLVIVCMLACDMDKLNNRIDDLSQQIESQSSLKKEEVATPTEAIVQMPEEPEKVEMELRTYFRTPSEPQEATREDEVALEDTETTESQEKASEKLEYAGIFELTAYEWTGNPCANGNYPTTGYTVASNYFPLGTKIYIEGMGEYMVEDTGGMADDVIDIYMGDYDTCIEFGRRQAGIYIVN